MNSETQAGQRVKVMVRGHLLDKAFFPTADAASEYKRAVRAWALERNVPVQMVCQDSTARWAVAS